MVTPGRDGVCAANVTWCRKKVICNTRVVVHASLGQGSEYSAGARRYNVSRRILGRFWVHDSFNDSPTPFQHIRGSSWSIWVACRERVAVSRIYLGHRCRKQGLFEAYLRHWSGYSAGARGYNVSSQRLADPGVCRERAAAS